MKEKESTDRDLLVAPPLVRVSVALLLDNRGLIVALTGQESISAGLLVLVLLLDGVEDD